MAPAGLVPVEFGTAARASLDRRVRAVARLTADIGRRTSRIRALALALVPTITTALSEGLNHTETTPTWPCWNATPTPGCCWPPARPG